MKYAIIRIGGKQFKIVEGNTFEVERQKELDIDVLAYSNGEELVIGTPTLDNVKIGASFEDEKKGKKIRVARFKSKSKYRKVRGHRQSLSVIKINSIETSDVKKANEVKEVKTTASKSKKAVLKAKAVKPVKKVVKTRKAKKDGA